MKRKDLSPEKDVLMNERSKEESNYSTFSDVGSCQSSLNTSENKISPLDNSKVTDDFQVCNTCTKL